MRTRNCSGPRLIGWEILIRIAVTHRNEEISLDVFLPPAASLEDVKCYVLQYSVKILESFIAVRLSVLSALEVEPELYGKAVRTAQ